MSTEITLIQIQSFKKGSLSQLIARGCRLATVSNSSIDLYEFKESEKARKAKYEITSPVKHIEIAQ